MSICARAELRWPWDRYGVAVYDQTTVQTPRRRGRDRRLRGRVGAAGLLCGGTTAAVVGSALLEDDNDASNTGQP